MCVLLRYNVFYATEINQAVSVNFCYQHISRGHIKKVVLQVRYWVQCLEDLVDLIFLVIYSWF